MNPNTVYQIKLLMEDLKKAGPLSSTLVITLRDNMRREGVPELEVTWRMDEKR